MAEMLDIGNSTFYIDLKAFDRAITASANSKGLQPQEKEVTIITDESGKIVGNETIIREVNKGKEIDAAKYELLRMFMEVLVDNNEPEGEAYLGVEKVLESKSFAYKIIFNTLVKEGIIKEKEE